MSTHAERISAHIVPPVSVLYWKRDIFGSHYYLATMLKLLPLLIIGCACAAPAENIAEKKTAAVALKDGAVSDLNADASSYYDRYSDYGSRSYPSTYGGGYGAGVSGYGTGGYGGVGGYGAAGYGGVGGYGTAGYGGVTGYGDDRYGVGGSDGYDRGYPGSYGGVGGYAGYDRGYGASSGGYGSYGGYGGNGGNGGLNSYYGYNSPSYQGYGHTGYGYYNKRPGYSNIYSSGITPSLVTGYRGYSKK